MLELPATAIVYSPYGNSVYVVLEKGAENGTKQLVVEQRFVTTGARRGDQGSSPGTVSQLRIGPVSPAARALSQALQVLEAKARA